MAVQTRICRGRGGDAGAEPRKPSPPPTPSQCPETRATAGETLGWLPVQGPRPPLRSRPPARAQLLRDHSPRRPSRGTWSSLPTRDLPPAPGTPPLSAFRVLKRRLSQSPLTLTTARRQAVWTWFPGSPTGNTEAQRGPRPSGPTSHPRARLTRGCPRNLPPTKSLAPAQWPLGYPATPQDGERASWWQRWGTSSGRGNPGVLQRSPDLFTKPPAGLLSSSAGSLLCMILMKPFFNLRI